MKSNARPLSVGSLALALAALPSVARAEPSAAPFLPTLTIAGQVLGASGAPNASTLLPGLGGQNKPLPLQIDGGDNVWRGVTFTWADNGSAFATVYVFNQAISPYQTGKEYWFINKSTLSKLGSAGLSVSVTDSSSMTAPPNPGYSPEQGFVLAQSPGWGTGWTSDPVSGGHLYDGPSSLHLRIATSGTDVSHVTWYQVLSSGSPANIDPAGSWTVDSSGSVSVPSGSTGYDISQAPPG